MLLHDGDNVLLMPQDIAGDQQNVPQNQMVQNLFPGKAELREMDWIINPIPSAPFAWITTNLNLCMVCSWVSNWHRKYRGNNSEPVVYDTWVIIEFIVK